MEIRDIIFNSLMLYSDNSTYSGSLQSILYTHPPNTEYGLGSQYLILMAFSCKLNTLIMSAMKSLPTQLTLSDLFVIILLPLPWRFSKVSVGFCVLKYLNILI